MTTGNATPSKELRTALARGFRRIVVFSGAGMSADSGIPTFRGGKGGLWQDFDPQELATPGAWQRDSATVWGWYEWRRGLVMQARPHAGHLAAARMQRGLGAAIVTQNVDDLHERAGAGDVLHLHGSLFAPRCADCGAAHGFATDPPEAPVRQLAPPRCAGCGGEVRPGVVWFGEALDEGVLQRAARLVSECDLLLVVGTSGVVYPAAGLVAMAPRDALVVEVNPEPARSPRVDHVLAATAAAGLPQVLEALAQSSPSA